MNAFINFLKILVSIIIVLLWGLSSVFCFDTGLNLNSCFMFVSSTLCGEVYYLMWGKVNKFQFCEIRENDIKSIN